MACFATQAANARDCVEVVHSAEVDTLRLTLLMHAAPEADPGDDKLPRFARFQFLEVLTTETHSNFK